MEDYSDCKDEESTEIKELYYWNMNTEWYKDGYEEKQLPIANTNNMKLVTDKLNELITRLNDRGVL